MKRKIVIPIVAITVVAVLVIALVFVFMPPSPGPDFETGSRKAIILCSANDFYPYEAEEDYGGGNDATFVNDVGNWTFSGTNSVGLWDPIVSNNTPGSLLIQPTEAELVSAAYTLNYSQFYELYEYAMYNLTVSVHVNSPSPIIGKGVRIGLVWLNSIGQVTRTDWSSYDNSTLNQWFSLNIVGVCNNETGNEITDLHLVLSVEGSFATGVLDHVNYDDLVVDKWIPFNNTNPTDPNPSPPPSRIDSDGFPAQALHVYWILKSHGYTDDKIFLMLYHTNDNVIDIKANDLIANDLIGALIDVENDDVNSSRFKQELNVSISGSFASGINSKDQLIIFMTDHGSNAVLGDGNATFHFEADNSFITEFEFYDLVKEIDCERIMINVDSCFSGNFLNSNKNIGSSWYDIPNCLFVSASSNVFSWYWISNNNGDGFAGSWFFHQFWEQLDQNQTISNAFIFAINFIPWNQFMPLIATQMPLMYDNMGINTTLSFNSDPPL